MAVCLLQLHLYLKAIPDVVSPAKLEDMVRDHEFYDDILNLRSKQDNYDITDSTYRHLQDRIMDYEKKIKTDILTKSKIVISTVNNSIVQMSEAAEFVAHVILVDEAAQVPEAQFWNIVRGNQRVVLVGDPQQLPAFVRTESAKKQGMAESLMERLLLKRSQFAFIMLRRQYRMNERIMRWSSDNFYFGNLVADDSVKNLAIKQRHREIRAFPFLFCNTDSENDPEIKKMMVEKSENDSFINEGEADLVIDHLKFLLNEGIDPFEIGVITPYFAQEQLKKFRYYEFIAVDTVDGFQGQERQIIIFSVVRMNNKGNLGFLNDVRRLNVAITRAACQFVLIGSAWMLSKAKPKAIQNLNRSFGKNENIGGIRITPDDLRGQKEPEFRHYRNSSRL
ncbi:unnamed protein product [Caenorhabditis bovis]|uniref:DNA2/NAM7 helicase-like C-terminal domain-containing protein n=1 Tax=Caenorhabditis bovis TaxID=2654633 RepID=A0A8S1ELS3_9PELO|nr:unnamed protein product [Caenorhabditis bovis]